MKLCENVDVFKVIVDKSTVPVGTADKVTAIIKAQTNVEFDVVFMCKCNCLTQLNGIKIPGKGAQAVALQCPVHRIRTTAQGGFQLGHAPGRGQ